MHNKGDYKEWWIYQGLKIHRLPNKNYMWIYKSLNVKTNHKKPTKKNLEVIQNIKIYIRRKPLTFAIEAIYLSAP